MRFLECHSVLKVARRWTVREARLSPGACSTQTYMYEYLYIRVYMYADLYKYLSSESADGVGEYVVY